MEDQIHFPLSILDLKRSTVSLKDINDKYDFMINLKYLKDNFVGFIYFYFFERAIIYTIKVLALSVICSCLQENDLC